MWVCREKRNGQRRVPELTVSRSLLTARMLSDQSPVTGVASTSRKSGRSHTEFLVASQVSPAIAALFAALREATKGGTTLPEQANTPDIGPIRGCAWFRIDRLDRRLRCRSRQKHAASRARVRGGIHALQQKPRRSQTFGAKRYSIAQQHHGRGYLASSPPSPDEPADGVSLSSRISPCSAASLCCRCPISAECRYRRASVAHANRY